MKKMKKQYDRILKGITAIAFSRPTLGTGLKIWGNRRYRVNFPSTTTTSKTTSKSDEISDFFGCLREHKGFSQRLEICSICYSKYMNSKKPCVSQIGGPRPITKYLMHMNMTYCWIDYIGHCQEPHVLSFYRLTFVKPVNRKFVLLLLMLGP